MDQQIFMPTLSHWEYGNPWSGDLGTARYWITPADGQMTAEMWRGPLSRQFSQIELTAQFPISEEGLADMTAWLLRSAAKLNSTAQEEAD